MKTIWLWLAVGPLFLWLGTGCGGINANGSVSPASFFLPGLMQNRPKTNPNQTVVSFPSAPAIPTADQSL